MDDLRILVEDQLPRLAYRIMSPLRDMPNERFPKGRHNFVRGADWDELDRRGKLHYAGPVNIGGSDGFHYKGRWPEGEGAGLMNQWWIGFYGYPYHQLAVSVKRGKPKMRQKIPTRKGIECRVRISVYNANEQDFDSLHDLMQVWRGLKSGSLAYSDYFGSANRAALSDDEIAGWTLPHAMLDLEVTGDRVRYSDTVYDHVPIPGKEELAAKYVQARLDAI